MYILDILDAYNESMEAMEYESLIREADDLINSIGEGINTFSNLIQVNSYYRRHGATESFRELIGEEGIMDTVTGALKSFGKWIIRKIKELVFFIGRLVADVFVGFANFFVGVFNMYRPVYIDYDLDTVFHTYVKATKCIIVGVSTVEFTTELLEAYKSFSDKLCEEYFKVTEPGQNLHIKTNRATIKAMANKINDVAMTASSILNRAAKRLDELTAEIERTKDDDKLKDMPNVLYNVLKGVSFIELKNLRVDEDTETPIRTKTSVLLQIISLCVKHQLKCYRRTVTVMQALHKVYDNTRYAIHMEFPWDSGVRERFRVYFGGGRFNPGKIIITNTNSETWQDRPGFRSSSDLGGATVVDEHTIDPEYNNLDIRISIAMLRSRLGRLAFARFGGSINKYKIFIRVLCHESRHVYNYQNHIVTPKNTQDAFYRFHKDERLAFKAMRRYEPTAEDLKWAKTVLDQVEAEIQKQLDEKQS